MKRVLDGILFGSGFGLAFVAILYLGMGFMMQDVNSSRGDFPDYSFDVSKDTFLPSEDIVRPSKEAREEVPFYDLEIDDQIMHATVIVVTEYQKAKDGEMKAIIVDILKKEKGVTFYYDIGDEYRSPHLQVPHDRTVHGDGEVIFLTGSPATMRVSMSYHGERVGSLGDMPLKLLSEKCETPST